MDGAKSVELSHAGRLSCQAEKWGKIYREKDPQEQTRSGETVRGWAVGRCRLRRESV